MDHDSLLFLLGVFAREGTSVSASAVSPSLVIKIAEPSEQTYTQNLPESTV